MSYNSKYKGAEVEGLLDSIGNKVDKVDGKQLSTEDFTTLLKNKLDGLSNYDDTEISQAVSKLRTDLDTLVSGDTTTAIKTFNEVIAFLDGIEDSESLDAIIASIEQQIAAKGTVTSVTAGNGLTGGSIIESGTISMPSVITAGTKGSSNSIQLTPSNPNGSETNASGKVIGSITVDEFGRVTDIKECSINLRTVYPKAVTTSYSGLMTASDKSKLNQCITSSAASTTYATKTSLNNKQDKLVSGTNIKTINGQSILGSGDIVIEGGSGGSSSGSSAYPLVDHGTSDTTFTLTPNTFHVWDEVASLDLSFADETAGVANEYLFQFTSGATATTLTLPDTIKWANDIAPTIAENMIYQMSVLRGLASVLEFKVNLQLIENLITVTLNGVYINASSQYPVMSDITITTNCGIVTIANGDSNGTSRMDAPEPTLNVLQIIPSSDNTYAYTY